MSIVRLQSSVWDMELNIMEWKSFVLVTFRQTIANAPPIFMTVSALNDV